MVARHCLSVSTVQSGEDKTCVNTSMTLRDREINSKLSSRDRMVSSCNSTGSSTIALQPSERLKINALVPF